MSLIKTNNELDKLNNISLYKSELALKNKQILNLQNKINNLILNKNSLISQIDKSKKNTPSSKNISPRNNRSNNKLYSSIQTLEYENSLLRNKLNLGTKIGDKYRSTFQYKLLSAEKEIENLTIMNSIKDNIIMNMENFINNLNNIFCNGKINLNLNKLNLSAFITNLKKLEQKIIQKIQKIPKPNKIPESIIRKVKEIPIKKQNTEFALMKKKQLYIYPLNQRNTNKLYTQTSINDSKHSNNSLIKQNFTCQNYSKKKMKNLKEIIALTERNNSIHKKNNLKENTLKLKRFLLSRREDIHNKRNLKKHMKSLDNRFYNDYLKTINNEMSLSRLLSDNSNGGLPKKTIDN